MVVSAPTGSGKTGLMELAILKTLSENIDRTTGDFNHTNGSKKTVYLAPTHALVNEKFEDWRARFGSIGLNVITMTDDDLQELGQKMKTADVILCTPERLDVITRKRKKLHMAFLADIALVLIDEVHILDDERGAAIEAIVSRFKLMSTHPEITTHSCPISKLRFVAVSATIPNVADVGEWLCCPDGAVKAYGEERRPVKLVTTVKGYDELKNAFLFERKMSSYLFDLITRYGKGKSVLIFCTSRNDAVQSASTLCERASHDNCYVYSREQSDALFRETANVKDARLRSMLCKGVGFHHAAMEKSDKLIVEQLFLARSITVLCATTTLAYGVNLPGESHDRDALAWSPTLTPLSPPHAPHALPAAYLVLIKSTRHWDPKRAGYKEYDRSLCLQMAGRAGRPQFETEGRCIVMTVRRRIA